MYEMDFFKYNYKDSLLPQNEVYPVRDVLSQRLNFDNLLERKHFTRIQIPCFFFSGDLFQGTYGVGVFVLQCPLFMLSWCCVRRRNLGYKGQLGRGSLD